MIKVQRATKARPNPLPLTEGIAGCQAVFNVRGALAFGITPKSPAV